MIVSLRIKYSAVPQRSPVAWLVPGETADAWLAELAAWNTPLASARLYALPRSVTDPRSCGVLVVGASPPAAGRRPRVFAYGLAGEQIYVPIDARIDPPVSDRELSALVDNTPHVWHPQAGLMALPPESALRVSDLLALPPEAAATWDAAVPGVALNGRLLSIEPDAAFDVQQVLEQGRDDIGGEAQHWDELPPSANEPPAGAASEAGRSLEKQLARLVQWITQKLPHTAPTRTWVNDLEDWARRRLAQIAESLEAARNREILRLLDLLKNKPEEGLRFALPMGDGGAHRGLAEPSDRLMPRNVDFNLNQLGGGRPADFWNLPPPYRQQLLARYRELANREIALGRHRRAAYIFATLLGDLKSAAATLADGGHWREAAVLYDQRLGQPLEAARCLRQGGLWAEAIALYERLGQHEIVGDLHQQLEQPQEAAAAWGRAVEAHLAADDRLAAAKILELKLAQPDDAYQRLVEAWPHSRQADKCLAEAFELCARQAWHPRAATLVAGLPARTPLGRVPALIDRLALEARNYPEPDVRIQAADQTRVVAAGRLASAGADDVQRIVQAVGRLVPEDLLLARDGQRFVRQRSRPRPRLIPARPAGTLVVQRELRLPGLDWRAAVSIDGGLVAAGYRDNHVVLFRAAWSDGALDEPAGRPWFVEPRQAGATILLAAHPSDWSPLVTHVLGNDHLSNLRVFAADDRFPKAMTAGSHRGLSAASVGMAYGSRDALYVADFHPDGALVVNAYLSADAQMLGLLALDLKSLIPAAEELIAPLPLLVREQTLYLGAGQYLCIQGQQQGTDTLELPQRIEQLAASAPHTRPRLAIGMAEGGSLLWGETVGAKQTPFASGMPRPKIAFTRGGWLIAAGEHDLEVYRTGNGQLQLHARETNRVGEPLAVLSTRYMDQFAVVGSGGHVVLLGIAH
jgi:tetratricopeptide (TPR) repeat protein